MQCLTLTWSLVGFSDNTESKHYRVDDEKGKLTIWEMNRYGLHEAKLLIEANLQQLRHVSRCGRETRIDTRYEWLANRKQYIDMTEECSFKCLWFDFEATQSL